MKTKIVNSILQLYFEEIVGNCWNGVLFHFQESQVRSVASFLLFSALVLPLYDCVAYSVLPKVCSEKHIAEKHVKFA